LLADKLDEIKTSGEATVSLAKRNFLIKQSFVDDLEKVSTGEATGEIGKALLILHSPVDELVGIENASEIYSRAKHPRSFVTLDDADHLLTRERDSKYAARTIAAWSERYLEIEDPEEDPDITIVRLDGPGFQTDVLAGGHRLVADEPIDVGSTDLGPALYDFLMASLGTCTAMTLRMYADSKKWPLKAVEVHSQHQRIDAEDCDECETEDGEIHMIHRELVLEGDLTEEQRDRITEIADKCPVHRTLESEILVRTHLKN
jgi:uncharacterized OsmC-like protein